MTDQPPPPLIPQFTEPVAPPEPEPLHTRPVDFPLPGTVPPRDDVDEAPERDEEAAAATPAAAPPRPDHAPPTPFAAGTYAVYEDGHGGVVLVIGTREGEVHQKHIPAKVIKMGELMLGGNNPFAAMIRGL